TPAAPTLYTLSLHDALPILLAAAGLIRLGRDAEVHEWLPFNVVLPAPGQGALVLQTRTGSRAGELAREVDHSATRRAVEAERARSEEHTSELQSRGHLVCRL